MHGIFIDQNVSKFIATLETKTQAKVIHSIELLENYGHFLQMPHSKKITSVLYELRIRGKQEIRLLYCFMKNIYLLHGFIKKTQKVPPREIHIAEQRAKKLANL